MHRILLEASQHANNAFITLTYSDETLPASCSLIPEDLQKFIKLLRWKISPAVVRYYAVGEYGDQTQRPHYHLILFGYSNCLRGQSRLGLHPRMVDASHKCCVHCDLIAGTWSKGGIFVGALEAKSAQYVAGYVMKKMTSARDYRLNGRHPEFARMSLKPGIGTNAMFDVADVMMKYNWDEKHPDVPSTLMHGKKHLPLGRTLRTKLRRMVGKDEKAPPEVLAKLNEEMLRLQQASIDSKEARSLKKIVQDQRSNQNASLSARQQILKSRKTL